MRESREKFSFTVNSFLLYLRLTVKIFQFLRLSTKFWPFYSYRLTPLRPSLISVASFTDFHHHRPSSTHIFIRFVLSFLFYLELIKFVCSLYFPVDVTLETRFYLSLQFGSFSVFFSSENGSFSGMCDVCRIKLVKPVFWAQLCEGQNPGLNLTRVSFCFFQTHFLGYFLR